MKHTSSRMGLAILSGGLAFVGSARATELIVDGSFENTSPSSNPVVKVGGLPAPGAGEGWSTFSTYLYSTQYTLPGPEGAGGGFLRPYPSGTYGITQSSTESYQIVSLTTGTTLTPAKIDAGQATFTMSAWFSSYLTQGDYSELTLEFLAADDTLVGFPELLGGSDFVAAIPTGSNARYSNAKEWGRDVRTGTIPAGARKARVLVRSTSVGGAPDGYVDVVSLDVVDSSLTIPALTSATPPNNAVGVPPVPTLAVTLENRVTSVDPASIQLFFDNQLVQPVVTSSGNQTQVTYAPGFLAALSSHTYRIVFGDTGTPSVRQTNSFSFTIADYVSLSAAERTPLGSEDASKPGFNVRVYQVASIPESDPPATQANLPASIAFLESVMNQAVGPNLADLTGAAETNRFEFPGTINWVNATGSAANFPEDTGFPGIPGTTGSEDSVVHEVFTYLRFPAPGFYQFGVNSADAFRLVSGETAAVPGVETLRITGATNFVVPCVPIATNITQLQFGGAVPASLSGPLAYGTPNGIPDEACSLSANTGLAGKVVILDRDNGGACNSAEKALQAQLAGATAVLFITPGDTGFPFRLGDINAEVRIPVLVIAESLGGSQLRALVQQGAVIQAQIATDTRPRLVEWDGPKGFGAVDAIGGFGVPEAGIYPVRLLAGHTSGAANLEWFSVKDAGVRALINDPSDPAAIRAFRARTQVVPPPVINPPTVSDGSITLSWTGSGTLQQSADLDGPWIDAPSQANPQSVPTSQGAQLFRVRQ